MNPKKSSPQTKVKNRRDSAVPEEPGQNVVTSFRWAWYALAAMVPFAGIFIALIFYDQDSRDVRKVGRNCLLIGFLIWIVFPVLVLLGFLLLGAASLFSYVSDMMPTD